MIVGLKDKWIITGYNGVPYSFPKSLQDEWFIDWKRCKRMPKSFKEECIISARMIGAGASQPIKILMSGGKDSEATARIFLEADVPFEGAILRQERDSNLYDIAWAIIFCELNNVPYKFYDVKASKYYSDPAIHKKYSQWDRTSNYSSWIYLVDQVDGFVIGCNGCIYEHIYKSNPDVRFEHFSADNNSTVGDYVFPPRLVEMNGDANIKSKWFYGITEQMGFLWDNYYYYLNKEAMGSFFAWRPEQMLAQLLDPFTQKILNNEFSGIYIGNQLKNEFFQIHWPEMISRPKYTGNELLFKFPEYKEFRKRNKDTLLQEKDIKQRRFYVDNLIERLMPE